MGPAVSFCDLNRFRASSSFDLCLSGAAWRMIYETSWWGSCFAAWGKENKHPEYQAKGWLLTSKSFLEKGLWIEYLWWWTGPIPGTGGRVGTNTAEAATLWVSRAARGRKEKDACRCTSHMFSYASNDLENKDNYTGWAFVLLALNAFESTLPWLYQKAV